MPPRGRAARDVRAGSDDVYFHAALGPRAMLQTKAIRNEIALAIRMWRRAAASKRAASACTGPILLRPELLKDLAHVVAHPFQLRKRDRHGAASSASPASYHESLLHLRNGGTFYAIVLVAPQAPRPPVALPVVGDPVPPR